MSEYRRDGYTVLPNGLSDAELSMLRQTCDTLLAEPPKDGGAGLHNIGLGEARRFLRHRHGDFPELKTFVLGKTMADIARQCLGAEPYLFNEQFVVKGAGKGASFAWHQDSAYVGFDHTPYVTIWMALDDTSEANGCVYLLPRDIDANPQIDPHEWQDDTNELNGYFGDDPGLPMECTAGTVVAFSSITLHRSGPNTTDRPRRAYIAQYSAEPIRDPKTGELKRFATAMAA
ncbi:MAG: phytanoyl-CoA dioxygenase family protein [Paracoccaceae bacterium]|nr:phytanoyl-CoA dioxygenase family protein [Paracoccaceae bacterium]